ncbi:MAG: ATP-binding cassette domain-containing protein, partial [Acetatifactor sp.]|nr:ATP-binding cassette domain-containing protein [Acetatifactor sp.]
DKELSGEMLCVEFKDVWFRYPGAEKYSLEAVNVTLNKGEIMTIVGENGSGKTTFVKLLLGLYRPTRGEILLNGVNIDRYSDEEYRKIFAPVFQDYRLFAYTIRENLVFDGEYHKAEAEALLAELGLDKKIGSLPDGVEQYVGKGYEKSGVDFSGGESQKLAIARALLKGSVCVVLDEPTAALDPIAEMELYRQINGLAGEKSCVFITHRLAGVRFSSRILYFENGRIAEQGSCQMLLEKEGKFYEFYQLQAQMYLNESM